MSASSTLIGIRLAGPVVRCKDGRSVTIPWEFVAGSSTRLRTTEAARLLHPGVPERLAGLRGVGTVTTRGLRYAHRRCAKAFGRTIPGSEGDPDDRSACSHFQSSNSGDRHD